MGLQGVVGSGRGYSVGVGSQSAKNIPARLFFLVGEEGVVGIKIVEGITRRTARFSQPWGCTTNTCRYLGDEVNPRLSYSDLNLS